MLKNTDWLTILMYLVLVFTGWLSIYSAVYDDSSQGILDLGERYGKQMIWIGAAFLLAVMVFLIDTKFFYVFSYIFYSFSILLLIGVLFLGIEVSSSKSWFQIAGIQIQPSEFAKLTTALVLGRFLSSYSGKLNNPRNLINIGGIILLPVSLIMMQPDVGSSSVFLAFTLMLYREGLSLKIFGIGLLIVVLFILALLLNELNMILFILAFAAILYWIMSGRLKFLFIGLIIFGGFFGIISGLNEIFSFNIKLEHIIVLAAAFSVLPYLFIALFHRMKYVIPVLIIFFGSIFFTYSTDYIFDNVLQPHHQKRINVILGIENDPLGEGYNVNQSKIAIGSGGLYGKGYMQGTQTKFNFVPEQSTDFIFCTIGEEFGFAGSFLLILIFVVFLLRLIYLSERQRSVFSRIFGYCTFSLLFFHFAVNIGMTLGLVPVVGIPLPFLSYGGSSLWSFTIMLFIFLKMDAVRMSMLK